MSSIPIPTELSIENIKCGLDLPTEFAAATQKEKTLVCADLLNGKTSLNIKLVGQLTTDAIQVSDYGAHTIGFAFQSDDDLAAFGKLLTVFDSMPGVGEGWSITDPIKNGRLYIKLRMKNNRYLTRSNIKLNPKNATTAPLYRYQGVEIHAEVKAYFDIEKKQAGVYFTVFNLIFDKD